MPKHNLLIRNSDDYPEANEYEKIIQDFKMYDNISYPNEIILGLDMFKGTNFYMSPNCEKIYGRNIKTQAKKYDFDDDYAKSFNDKIYEVVKILISDINLRKKLKIQFDLSFFTEIREVVFSKSSVKEIRNGFFVIKSKITNNDYTQPQRMTVINKETGEVLLDLSDKVKKLLSDREMEVVELLARGNNDKEIAKALSLSKYTILTHRQNIIKKMGAKNTVEAVVKAYRLI